MRPLTTKQRKFVSEYPVDSNATAAAIRAGFSAKAAQVTGSRLLDKPQVQAALAKTIERYEKKTETNMEYVIQKSRDAVEWFEKERKANGRQLALACDSAKEALDRLAKIFGVTTKLELTGRGGGPIHTRHVNFSGYSTALLEKFINSAEG